MISLNLPNFITIGLMAIASFMLFGVVWQMASRAMGGSGAGEPEVSIATGGDVDVG